MLKLESRHHALRREELDDVSLFGRHDEFIGLFAKHKTHETVRAVRSSSSYTVVATDGKFDFVTHHGTLHFPPLCSVAVTRQTLRYAAISDAT